MGIMRQGRNPSGGGFVPKVKVRNKPLTERDSCHSCYFVIAECEKKDIFDGKGYHSDCLESPNFGKNGTADVLENLWFYHLKLKAKRKKTAEEKVELKRLSEVLRKHQ